MFSYFLQENGHDFVTAIRSKIKKQLRKNVYAKNLLLSLCCHTAVLVYGTIAIKYWYVNGKFSNFAHKAKNFLILLSMNILY